MKYLVPFLLLLGPASAAASDEAALPYRVLWHAYQLSRVSGRDDDRLRIVSDRGVAPELFVFSPRTSSGRPPVRCEAGGITVVEWDEQFYSRGQRIVSNQPAGTLGVRFGCQLPYQHKFPVLWNLFLSGERYCRAAYHAYYVMIEINRGDDKSPPNQALPTTSPTWPQQGATSNPDHGRLESEKTAASAGSIHPDFDVRS